ncbi:MAG: class I SAM-dependent methyltransferase [Deltaproteobacteria bacterium]|nr:class I SAM-dependent methyltransferase [Deltaproteobacteria bacterium]
MSRHVQKVGALFDEWAREGRAEGMERTHARAARPAFERLGVGAGHRYLDVGCGNGYSVRWAVEAGAASALGVDLSEEMIARAREQSRGHAAASFLQAAFPGGGLPAGGFDRIFSMEAYYYLADLDAALEATRALLAPGGRFACTIDHYLENEESHGWSEELGLSLHLLGAAEWSERFSRAGFEEIEQEAIAGSLLTLGRRP